jgi:hypothetical protein
MEVKGIQGRRRKQILETRRYWKLKEGALDRSLWRTRFGGDKLSDDDDT